MARFGVTQTVVLRWTHRDLVNYTTRTGLTLMKSTAAELKARGRGSRRKR
jgi:hypothetical protein